MSTGYRLLVQHGKQYLVLLLWGMGTTLVVVGLLDIPRSDWLSFIALGVAFLSVGSLPYLSLRRTSLTEGDVHTILLDLGFVPNQGLFTAGRINARLRFRGGGFGLVLIKSNWASRRLLDFSVPCGLPLPEPVTVQKASGDFEPLAIRKERQVNLGAVADSRKVQSLQPVLAAAEYLDVNLSLQGGTLTIGVFGNTFNGPELKSNIQGAFSLAQSVLAMDN